jgi:peptide/nickel transport system permease protein
MREAQPLAPLALAIVFAVVLLAFIGGLIAPHDPEIPAPGKELLPPGTAGHLLGTDVSGLDILSRLLTAPRTDLTIGLVSTALAIGIGVPIGAMAGYFEGRKSVVGFASEGTMRVMDILQAFPVFILALVLVGIRGPSVTNIIIAVAFVNMPVFVRLVRSELQGLRERPFVEAARCSGASEVDIAFRHLLPNAMRAVWVQSTVTIGFAILLTASLSFVGAGIRPPTPELGLMISGGAQNLVTGQVWPSLIPGLFLGMTVFGFAILGDALVAARGHGTTYQSVPTDQTTTRLLGDDRAAAQGI